VADILEERGILLPELKRSSAPEVPVGDRVLPQPELELAFAGVSGKTLAEELP
jgi:hypothetical protein